MLRIRQPIIKTDVVQQPVQDTAGYVALYRNFNVGTQTQQPQVFAQVNRGNYLGKDLSFLWTASSINRDSVGELPDALGAVNYNNMFVKPTERGLTLAADVTTGAVNLQLRNQQSIVYTSNPRTIRVPGSSFTVGAVFRVKNTASSSIGLFDVTNSGSWYHQINFSSSARVSIDFVASGAVATNLLSDNTYAVGDWLSVVVVFKSGDTHFYINGVKQTQVSTATLATTGLERVILTALKTDILTCFTSRAVWDENSVKSWTANPWQLFRTTQPHYAVAPAVDEPKKLWGAVRKYSSMVNHAGPFQQPTVNSASTLVRDLAVLGLGGRPQPQNFTWINAYTKQTPIITAEGNPAAHPNNIRTFDPKYGYGQKVVDSVSWGNSGVNTVSLAQLVDNANTAGLSMMWIGRIDTSGQGTAETALVSYANGGQYGPDRFSLYTNTGGVKNKLSARIRNVSGTFINTPTVDLPLDRAVCVVVTHHKVQGQKLYIDGKLVAQQNTTVNVDVQSTNANQFTCNTVNNNRNYIAAAWNRALTDTEIQQIYENPHQLYQQPHQTWYTTGILDTTPLENIGFRYNSVKQSQRIISNSISNARLDFCLLAQNNQLIDLNRKVNRITSNGASGFDELGSYVSTDTAAMLVPGYTATAGGPRDGGWKPDVNASGTGKVYTFLYVFKVLSEDDGGEEPVNLTNDSTGLGWRVISRMTYLQAANYYNRIRVQSSGTVLGAYVNGIVLDDAASTSTLKISRFDREVGKYYVVAATVTVTQTTWPHAQHYHRIGSNSGEFVKIRTPLYAVWDGALPNAMLKSLSENPWQIFQDHKQYYYYTKPDPVSGNVAKLPRPIAQHRSQPLNITTVDRGNSFGRNTQFLWTAAAPRYDATGNYRATNSSDITGLQSAGLFGEPPNITASAEGLQYTSTATPVGGGTGGALVFRGNNTSSATGDWVPAPAGTGTGITVVILGRYTSTASNQRLLGWTNQQNSGTHDTFQIVGGNPRIQYPNSYTKTPNYAGTTTSPYTLSRVHLTAYVSTLTQQYIYVDGNMVFQTSDVHYGGARGPSARLAIVPGGMAPIMIAVINKGLTKEEVLQLGQNPWQLYKQTQQHLFYSPKPEPQPYVLRIPHTKQLAQPQAQATSNIDWGNPLSRGLLGSFTPLAQYNANNEPATVQGTTITTQYSPSGAIWRNTQLAAATNYIRVPRGNFNYTTAVTFEALFKLNSAPYQASPTRVPGIMSQWQHVGGADARGPRLAMIHQFGNFGRLQFSVPVGASTTRTITQATPYLEPGKTYHIVATFAPSSPTAATLFLYINGQLNVSGNPFTGTFVNDVNNFISLMSDYVDNNAANPSADIDLYLARIYNVAKTATEVRELYRNPWQLYQTPKPTFAISQQIKPLELATITSRRPYRQQPQAALSVDTGQTSFAKLLFCLVPQNNRLRDIGPRRVVTTIAATTQTNVVTGHDAYGHFVHNPYGTQINVGGVVFPTFNNTALLDKTYTVLVSFLVESNVAGEQIIATQRPGDGAGFQLTTKQPFDSFRQDSFRANCSGLNAEMYSAYVDGRPFETRTGTQSIYTTFTRQYNKLHTVAATFKTSNVHTMREHYLGNMQEAGSASVASRYYLYVWWEGRLPDAMLKSLSENPWQIFEQNKKYSYFAGEYPSAEAPPEPPLVLNSRFLLFFG